MKYCTAIFCFFLLVSCSPKFQTNALLLGSWKSLNAETPDIFFDSTRYYLIISDSSKKTAYALNYRLDDNTITAFQQNANYAVNTILQLTKDTLVLKNNKTEMVSSFVKNHNNQ